jgi:hypothetical protein
VRASGTFSFAECRRLRAVYTVFGAVACERFVIAYHRQHRFVRPRTASSQAAAHGNCALVGAHEAYQCAGTLLAVLGNETVTFTACAAGCSSSPVLSAVSRPAAVRKAPTIWGSLPC